MSARFSVKFGVYTVRILTGLLALLAVLVWLAGSETALRWSAHQAERMSNDNLELNGVNGSLYGPLRVETLSFQAGDVRYEAQGVEIDWNPGSLFMRHIQITRLIVRKLRITGIKLSPEPFNQPLSLNFPLALSAPAISIDQFLLNIDDTEYQLHRVNLGVDKPDDNYLLALHNIDTEWGKGEAQIRLAGTRPFRISASATMQQTDGWSYRAQASASGSLYQLPLNIKMTALGGHADIDANLALFEPSIIADAKIKATGINPALFRKGLPKADLDAEVSVVDPWTNDMAGRVVIRNKLPGSWDSSHWPLREMTGHFTAAPHQLDLNDIHLNLAGAGEFNGNGYVKNKQLQLDLSTKNLNPHGLHSKMRRMLLAGNIRLQSDALGQELSANLKYQRYRMRLDARHRDDVVEIRQGSVQSGDSNFTFHGALALKDLNQFELEADLHKFNPADFGDYTEAEINASFSGAGHLAADPEALFEFSIANSQFLHQKLAGQGRMNISGTRIWNSDALLQLAHNQLEFNGALGRPDDRITFRIKADNLATINPQLEGELHATGDLEGSFSAPSGHIDLQASNLGWGKDYHLSSLRAAGQLDRGIDGLLALKADLRGLDLPQLNIDQASMNARGTRAEHTLLFMAKSPDLDLEGKFVGGWLRGSAWSGLVMELSNRGRHAFTLKSLAELEVARQRFNLRNVRLDVAGGNLAVHEFTYNTEQTESSGEFHDLSLGYLQDFTERPVDLKHDLTLSGNWRFAINDKINGNISVWREQGDVYLPVSPPTPLGLRRIRLNVGVADNQLQSQLEASGDDLGSVEADAHVAITRHNGAWAIAGDTPVTANATLSVGSLSWIASLFNRNSAITFDGALSAEIHTDGTLAQPKMYGNVSGDHLTLALPNHGLSFTDGRLRAKLQHQELLLDNLSIRGGDGNLTGQGKLNFGGEMPVMQLSLVADKLEALSRPDRHLILSGTGDVAVTGKKLKITTKLKADRGLIVLPKSDTREPSDDVIILDQPEAAEKKKLPYALSFDLDLDLGERFFIKGKGLDAQLGGAIKLASVDGSFPASSGNIKVIKGAYTAYGQRLEIERGILNFQGPLDNPGINILALRKNQPVEAGVAVTGTAQSPRVNLVSTPDVPVSEKLSWVVLGHGLESSSGQDLNALQAAAGALLTYGESITLQQRIAYATGFEDVSLKGSGQLEGTVLTLGKRLSKRAYLSYEQGLSGANSLIKVNYMLTEHLSAQAQSGTAPAADLFYIFSFD